MHAAQPLRDRAPRAPSPERGYAALDPALAWLADFGPDLRSGLANHAPMVVEALCALSRGDAVPAWLESQRPELAPWPAERAPIEAQAWRAALARPERSSDWRAFFRAELERTAWRDVLERWCARLAPAVAGNATHGLIRVSQGVHKYLKEKNVPHIWHVDDHAHDFEHWKKGLYNFSQQIFKPATE